ncbi:MAG: sigma-70 family RNA polymerase sigma factor [Planctomycetota bacterium]
MTDPICLARLRNGHDAEAFGVLLQRYRGRVLAVCRRRLNNEADAEDATQDVFVKLLESARGIDDNLEGWLVRCARNTCVDVIRSHTRRRKYEAWRHGAAGATAEASGARLEDREFAGAMLRELAADDARLLMGHVASGATQRELASHAGVSQQAVAARLKKLRVQLQSWSGRVLGGLSLSGLLGWATQGRVALAIGFEALRGGLQAAAPEKAAAALALACTLLLAQGDTPTESAARPQEAPVAAVMTMSPAAPVWPERVKTAAAPRTSAGVWTASTAPQRRGYAGDAARRVQGSAAATTPAAPARRVRSFATAVRRPAALSAGPPPAARRASVDRGGRVALRRGAATAPAHPGPTQDPTASADEQASRIAERLAAAGPGQEFASLRAGRALARHLATALPWPDHDPEFVPFALHRPGFPAARLARLKAGKSGASGGFGETYHAWPGHPNDVAPGDDPFLDFDLGPAHPLSTSFALPGSDVALSGVESPVSLPAGPVVFPAEEAGFAAALALTEPVIAPVMSPLLAGVALADAAEPSIAEPFPGAPILAAVLSESVGLAGPDVLDEAWPSPAVVGVEVSPEGVLAALASAVAVEASYVADAGVTASDFGGAPEPVAAPSAFVIAAVPEPASLAVLVSGLLLTARRRRG